MLKFIISPLVGLITFFLGAVTVEIFMVERGSTNFQIIQISAVVTILIIAIIATIITYKQFPKKEIKQSIAEAVSFARKTKNDITDMTITDDSELFAIAENEVNDGVVSNGLWSQALVSAEGDESKRKIEYMKLRVKQLKKHQQPISL